MCRVCYGPRCPGTIRIGRFGPIPVRSGRFGPSRFGPISGVSRFGPVGACRFGPISGVGRFGPIFGVSRFGLIYFLQAILLYEGAVAECQVIRCARTGTGWLGSGNPAQRDSRKPSFESQGINYILFVVVFYPLSFSPLSYRIRDLDSCTHPPFLYLHLPVMLGSTGAYSHRVS